MVEDGNVQQVEVPEGTTTTEGPAQPTPPSTTPLSTEAIQAMINRGITEGIERAKQSARDTARFEVESLQKRVAQSNVYSEAAIRQLEQHDPDGALKLRQAKFNAEVNQRQMSEQEQQQQTAHVEFVNNFYREETEAVVELGIDPKDNRIDWGVDAATPTEAHKRILKSTVAIMKERAKVEKATRDETSSREANSVVTEVPVATRNTSGIPTDLAKFREWLGKIPQEEYETTYAAKVNEMRRQGKFK